MASARIPRLSTPVTVALSIVGVVVGAPLCFVLWFVMIYESDGAGSGLHPGSVISSLIAGGLFGALVGAPTAYARYAPRVALFCGLGGAGLWLLFTSLMSW